MANKYIDADRLKAEIERRIELICTTEGLVRRDKLQEYETLRDIEDFITSLQQEHPEEMKDDEKIMNFFDALGDCGFSQHDILLLKDIWKEAGCLPPKPQVADASQMEPEVDLEKEINRYQREDMDRDTTVRDVARHFYELGLNARKEKNKNVKE